jgi:hypothetical protein
VTVKIYHNINYLPLDGVKAGAGPWIKSRAGSARENICRTQGVLLHLPLIPREWKGKWILRQVPELFFEYLSNSFNRQEQSQLCAG